MCYHDVDYSKLSLEKETLTKERRKGGLEKTKDLNPKIICYYVGGDDT